MFWVKLHKPITNANWVQQFFFSPSSNHSIRFQCIKCFTFVSVSSNVPYTVCIPIIYYLSIIDQTVQKLSSYEIFFLIFSFIFLYRSPFHLIRAPYALCSNHNVRKSNCGRHFTYGHKPFNRTFNFRWNCSSDVHKKNPLNFDKLIDWDQFVALVSELTLDQRRSCRLHKNINDNLFVETYMAVDFHIKLWLCIYVFCCCCCYFANRFNFIVLSFREFGIVFHLFIAINFTGQWRASHRMCNSFVLHVDKYRFTDEILFVVHIDTTGTSLHSLRASIFHGNLMSLLWTMNNRNKKKNT